jgi:hypothetical protein
MNQINSVEPLWAGIPWNGTTGDGAIETETRSHNQSCEGARGAAMSRSDTLPFMSETQSAQTCELSLEVLIAVPAVRAQRMRHFRPATAPARVGRVWPIGRKKRRLRREVRLVGCALLALTPLVSACTIGWSSRPARILACAIPDSADSSASRTEFDDPGDPGYTRDLTRASMAGSLRGVTLSIEPAPKAPVASAEIPVIFSGYVLPSDSLEDRAHAGN